MCCLQCMCAGDPARGLLKKDRIVIDFLNIKPTGILKCPFAF